MKKSQFVIVHRRLIRAVNKLVHLKMTQEEASLPAGLAILEVALELAACPPVEMREAVKLAYEHNLARRG